MLGEAYSGAKELQARAGGKTYKDSGKYTEAFLQGQKYGEGDLTFDELLEHKGVSPYGRGWLRVVRLCLTLQQVFI